MKKIKNQGAQGDVLFRRIEKIPNDATKQPRTRNGIIVAHSETGHHHVILDAGVEHFRDTSNELLSYLQVDTSGDVVHLRPFDTHETMRLGAGAWEVRIQREHAPEGWRRVED